MPITMPDTIPEGETLSSDIKEQGKVTYKLIKLSTFDNDDGLLSHAYGSKDKADRNTSHLQLFFDITDKTKSSKNKVSYFRELYQPDERIRNLYWYTEALKSVSSSSDNPTTLWTIDQVKIKKSKINKQIRRPRTFSISNNELGIGSVFEYNSSKTEPKGYSCEIVTPCDHSCIQRYRWIRYKDGSGWAFIYRNDPNTFLVELRKTDLENEFEIAFLEDSPPGWRLGNMIKQQNSTQFNHSVQFMGRYPSVFSNPSSYRSSTTSGLLSNFSNRESTLSSISNVSSVNATGERFSTLSNVNKMVNNKKPILPSIYSESHLGNIAKLNSEKYWQEFVLASTVAIQDEVNPKRRRLWKK